MDFCTQYTLVTKTLVLTSPQYIMTRDLRINVCKRLSALLAMIKIVLWQSNPGEQRQSTTQGLTVHEVPFNITAAVCSAHAAAKQVCILGAGVALLHEESLPGWYKDVGSKTAWQPMACSFLWSSSCKLCC